MPMPPGEPGLPRPRTDGARLRLAVKVVLSREGITVNRLAKATGVRHAVIGDLIRFGQPPCGDDVVALLAYMHLDPSEVTAAPAAEPASPAEAGEAA